MLIRSCEIEDFPEVFRLLRQLWPDRSLDEAAMRRVFEIGLGRGDQAFYCIAENGRLIAFGSLHIRNNLWQQGELAQIDELVVDEARRGSGLGAMLLKKLMDEARSRGCGHIELATAMQRLDAHRFYERQGFERAALVFGRKL